jgi:hypothetical protein
LTPDGLISPFLRFDADESANARIWSNLPPLYWYSESEKIKPAAQVFLEHPKITAGGKPLPLLTTQFYGAGRTLFQAFDGTWRWQSAEDDLYHARYWTQAMRYLSRTKLLGKNRIAELSVDRVRVRRGEPVQIRVQIIDAAKTPTGDQPIIVGIEKIGSSGQRMEIQLKRSSERADLFEGVFSQTMDGQYAARISSLGGESLNQLSRFTVLPPPGEMDQVRMNETELQNVAKQTGGKYVPIERADEIFEAGVLPFGRRAPIQNDPPYPLWRTWPTLILFASLLLTEWLLRKRNRMV